MLLSRPAWPVSYTHLDVYKRQVYELTFGSQEWQDLDRGTITREEGNAAMLELSLIHI